MHYHLVCTFLLKRLYKLNLRFLEKQVMQISVPSRSQTRLMKNPLHTQLPQGPVSELPAYTKGKRMHYAVIL